MQSLGTPKPKDQGAQNVEVGDPKTHTPQTPNEEVRDPKTWIWGPQNAETGDPKTQTSEKGGCPRDPLMWGGSQNPETPKPDQHGPQEL